MSRDFLTDIAESIPFDNDTNGFASDNVQEAIEEAQSGLAHKLRDPRIFSMNGTMRNGEWVTISELLSTYKYVFTEHVKMIGIEWSNSRGNDRSFDLVFYKNGTSSSHIIRTYEVRNSSKGYGYDTGWSDTFVAGDYMRVKYIDRGKNCADFGGRFNFEVL